jgi:hypothetical protein
MKNIFKNYYFVYCTLLDEHKNVISLANNIVGVYKFLSPNLGKIEKTLLKKYKKVNQRVCSVKVQNMVKL